MKRILESPLWCREIPPLLMFLLFFAAWGGQFLLSQLLMFAWQLFARAGMSAGFAVPEMTFGIWFAVLISELLGIAVLLAGWRVISSGRESGLRKLSREELLWVSGGLFVAVMGTGILTGFWGNILEFFKIPHSESQEVVDMFRRGGWAVRCMIAVTAVLVVPLFEELLFRKTLFGCFAGLGNIPAMVLTSVIFGVVHFFLLGMPGLCWIGLVFQILYLATGNIMVNTAAHGLLNFCALIAALFIPHGI